MTATADNVQVIGPEDGGRLVGYIVGYQRLWQVMAWVVHSTPEQLDRIFDAVGQIMRGDE